jgi:hypothetical protein
MLQRSQPFGDTRPEDQEEGQPAHHHPGQDVEDAALAAHQAAHRSDQAQE